jgi:hypothetical protein
MISFSFVVFIENIFFHQNKLLLSNTSLFEHKISEADSYLQLLINQVNVRIEILMI